MILEGRWFLWAALFGLMFFIGSCTVTPEQQKKIDDLKSTVTKLVTELRESKNVIDSLTVNILDLKNKISSGRIGEIDGYRLVEDLRITLARAYSHKSDIIKSLDDAKKQINDLDESGVSPWMTAWTVISTVGIAYLKVGNVKLGGALGKVVNSLSEHKDAIEGMSRALYTNDHLNGVVADISNLSHPVIEDIYHNRVKNNG